MEAIGFYCCFSSIEDYYNAKDWISLKTFFTISYYFILKESIGCGDAQVEVKEGETMFCFVCWNLYHKNTPEKVMHLASEIQSLEFFTDPSRNNYIYPTTAFECEWDDDLRLKKAKYFEDDFELTGYCYTHDLIDMESLSEDARETVYILKDDWEKYNRRYQIR